MFIKQKICYDKNAGINYLNLMRDNKKKRERVHMTHEQIMEQANAVKTMLNACEWGKIIPSIWTVPEGYKLVRSTVKGIPVERLIPENWNGKTLLNMHGGGYVLALSDLYREGAVVYSQVAGNAEVINFDYRTAPTHEAPAALEDAVTVYQWLLEQGTKPEDIVFIGDSAGGNLVLVTGLYLRDQKMPLPAGIFAISPWGSMESDLNSVKENWEKDYLLGKEGIDAATEVFDTTYHKNSDFKSPYVSPAYGDYTGMPSLLIQGGSYEVLLDGIVMVGEAVKKAGIDFTFSIYEEMPHVFQIALPELEQSKKAWAEAKMFFDKVFAK